MKFGFRTPSIKKSLKARTTGKLKRKAKSVVNPLYGKKGMGLVTDPKKSIYNKIYNKTTVSAFDLLDNKSSKKIKVDKETSTEEFEDLYVFGNSDKLKKMQDKFEKAYSNAFSEKDFYKKISLFEESMSLLLEIKEFCYSKGAGGIKYFESEYENWFNSSRPKFSCLDVISENLQELLDERDLYTPKILSFISDNQEILQKDIYDKLPDIKKSTIQKIIRRLESEGKIVRTKKSGSYSLIIA